MVQIGLLLHYLAVFWIWIGSYRFIGYEEGLDPWQLANEDFHDFSKYQLYVFSAYWVCTTISTVGYGDYAGGTTLEYIVSLGLEFFGLVVFSLLEVTVTTVINYDISYDTFKMIKDQRILQWI